MDRAFVYILTKPVVTSLATELRDVGLTVQTYTADLGHEQRRGAAAAWRSAVRGVTVATGGFGAGVDCATVRIVVNIGSYNLVSLGRVGMPARAVFIQELQHYPDGDVAPSGRKKVHGKMSSNSVGRARPARCV